MNADSLVEKFKQAGQGHVFNYFEQLSSEERAVLLAEAAEIDLDEVGMLTRTLLGADAKAGANFDGLAPASYERLPEKGGKFHDWVIAKSAGESALRIGRVAAFTVAGGQGTRLGYDGPKGTFAITPIKQKSLFQVFAEKLRAIGRRYGKTPLWFIMTSSMNHEATEAFFREHAFFGLDPARVHLFRQGRMAAVDFDGKILMSSRGAIAMSPDGHGGSLRALARSGALDLMQREGVDILSYFQVDNPLVRAIDPTFVGWHVLTGSEMSSKMVPKAYAGEKVGHFCTQGGRSVVIEYSDLPKEMQEEIEPKTRGLRYLAGSIAIHILDTKFIRRLADGGTGVALPFHRADKKVPTIDAQGEPVNPKTANGVKFELFIFDALPFAKNPVIIETKREDEFSPVKNAEGIDSPRTCKDDQVRQFTRWLNREGAAIATDESGLPAQRIEISPLFGYDTDSFAETWRERFPQLAIKDDLYLE